MSKSEVRRVKKFRAKHREAVSRYESAPEGRYPISNEQWSYSRPNSCFGKEHRPVHIGSDMNVCEICGTIL